MRPALPAIRTTIACLVGLFLLLQVFPAGAPAGDGACAVGSSGTALDWYFAEGYTGQGFQEFLSVLNPGDKAASVRVNLLYPDAAPGLVDLPVAPRSRATLDVNAAVGRHTDVSMTVKSDQPVVAERPMYFTYEGKWKGCTNALGALAPSAEWSFAEGTTRSDFEEWLCLANPQDVQASAQVELALEDGTLRNQTVNIPPHQRRTLDVNAAVGPEHDVSIHVKSDRGILAERAMYFNYKGVWQGGHASFGQPLEGAAASRYFAEGYTGDGFDTWLCLYHHAAGTQSVPGTDASTVPVFLTFMFEDGSTRTEPVALPVNRRVTYDLNQWLGPHLSVSIKVEGPNGIMAERPMYFNYHWTCRGGHVTSGATQPGTEWYFAEGTLRGGFEEWLCLQNPNGEAADVDVDYFSNEGGFVTRHYSVAPTARFTACLNNELPSFRGKDVSCVVRSDLPLVAERSLYCPGASFEVQNAMDNLAHLTQAIGQRVEGTAGEEAAAAWLASIIGGYRLNDLGYQVSTENVPLPDGSDTHNVVAKLSGESYHGGADAPLVILGAHFDTRGGTGTPGANDNGSGTVTILEVARCLVQSRPGVEVWVVFFGGEELLVPGTDLHHFGSRWFVDHLGAADRARLRGFFSVDMVGVGSQLYARHMGIGPESLLNELMSFAASRGIYLPYMKSGNSSDHEPFEKAGLPAVWLEYKDDPYYHTPQDSIDKIEPAYLELTGNLLLEFIRSL